MARWGERLGVAVCLLTAGALLFMYLDKYNAQMAVAGARGVDFETALDRDIPFVPAFVFAYLLYYPWLLLPLPILRERSDLYRVLAAFVVLEIAAAVVFVLVPSHMLRPTVVGSGLTSELMRWVYRVDPGWNLVPSLHAGHSLLVALFFKQLSPRFFPAVAIGTGLICASTVLIKQHYAVDVPIGLLFALAAYWVTTPVSYFMRAIELRDPRLS